MPKLAYVVSPVHINQGFGANPEYYAKFHDSYGQPEKGHMGVDFMAAHGTPLYAPCDGNAVYAEDEHGGDGIYITTSDNYRVVLWHMCSKNDPQFKPLIPLDGNSVQVKKGQHIGYTDNTGAPFESSGDHLHFGLIPLMTDGIRTLNPQNGFNGAIDPLPFFDGSYANEFPPATPVQLQEISILQKLIALYKQLLGK